MGLGWRFLHLPRRIACRRQGGGSLGFLQTFFRSACPKITRNPMHWRLAIGGRGYFRSCAQSLPPGLHSRRNICPAKRAPAWWPRALLRFRIFMPKYCHGQMQAAKNVGIMRLPAVSAIIPTRQVKAVSKLFCIEDLIRRGFI